MNQLAANTTVVVPTHGLQHSLQEHYALQQRAAGNMVWETPNIIVWESLIHQLYEQNKFNLGQPKITINEAQSYIVWQQAVGKLKKDNNAFVLLNEAQTASAVQRSWRLLHKWRIDQKKLSDRKDEDSQVFLELCELYMSRLNQSGWIDAALLENQIIDAVLNTTKETQGLPNKFVFAYFDLETTNHRLFKQACLEKGIEIERQQGQQQTQQTKFVSYESSSDELTAIFTEARQYLETNSEHRLGIVIPDLAQRRQEVSDIAQSIFYPDRSPVENLQKGRAYRFSMGRSLAETPYIATQLRLLNLLKPSFTYQDLSFILRNAWLPIVRHYPEQVMELTRSLNASRVVYWTWEKVLERWLLIESEPHPLTELFEQCIEFRAQLATVKNLDNLETLDESSITTAFTQSNQDWQHNFSEWLQVFEWQENDLDSYHYQAQKSWITVLETFASLDQVQPPIGLVKALRQIQTLSKDAVFMRQARNEPILISGVLEAVGRDVDKLFITSMNDTYPVTLGSDPFIANELLEAQQYPFAAASTEYEYEQRKMQSLMSGALSVSISYAKQQEDGEAEPSTLFQATFLAKQFKQAVSSDQSYSPEVTLESYQDYFGEPCRDSRHIKGGSAIFETQSNCPFKAYVNHRVMVNQQEEPEFGLDARDAGNVVHDLLENVWKDLGSSSTLALESTDIRAIATRHVEAYLNQELEDFKFDRKALLALESPRLVNLLEEWLVFERHVRQLGFSVVETEKVVKTEFAKIPITLKIDRIDRFDDGTELITDYKTGKVNKADWFGDRPKKPQLPLYALAYEEFRKQQNDNHETSAIALAQVTLNDPKMVGFAKGTDIVKDVNNKVGRSVVDWQDQLNEWHANLSALASEFLEGNAVVDPIDKRTCDFCDLSSVCRIHQMRSQSSEIFPDLEVT